MSRLFATLVVLGLLAVPLVAAEGGQDEETESDVEVDDTEEVDVEDETEDQDAAEDAEDEAEDAAEDAEDAAEDAEEDARESEEDAAEADEELAEFHDEVADEIADAESDFRDDLEDADEGEVDVASLEASWNAGVTDVQSGCDDAAPVDENSTKDERKAHLDCLKDGLKALREQLRASTKSQEEAAEAREDEEESLREAEDDLEDDLEDADEHGGNRSAMAAAWTAGAAEVRERCHAAERDANETKDERKARAHCIRDGYKDLRHEVRAMRVHGHDDNETEDEREDDASHRGHGRAASWVSGHRELQANLKLTADIVRDVCLADENATAKARNECIHDAVHVLRAELKAMLDSLRIARRGEA